MTEKQYRLVTRSDFDGLVCAVLLKKLQLINDIKFVHPKDMQDGKVEVTQSDIVTNLPYVGDAFLVFDHHHSETLRNAGERHNHLTRHRRHGWCGNIMGGWRCFPTNGWK